MEADDPTGSANPSLDLTSPPALAPGDVLIRSGLDPALAVAQQRLERVYRDNGSPAPIFEQRALALGRLCNYLESLMDAAPQTIGQHGPLYTRLVEAERRAWDAERVTRSPRQVNSPGGDLARIVDAEPMR